MTDEPKSEDDRKIVLSAHQWLAEVHEGGMDPELQAGLKEWLAADPRHKWAYRRAAGLWESVETLRAEDLLPTAPVLTKRRRWSWWAAGVTAVSTSIAVFFWAPRLEHYVDPQLELYETSIGERSTFALSDGTRLHLDAASRVMMRFDPAERSLTLRQGAVFLDVESDPDRPFRVHAEGAQVTVTGTKFSVVLANSSAHVAVLEGRVAVGATDQQKLGKEHEVSMALSAGQAVTVGPSGAMGDLVTVEPRQIAGWRNGRVYYVEAPISKFVAEANRSLWTWIVIADQQAAEQRITAALDTEDLGALLQELPKIAPVEVLQPIPGVAVIRSSD